MQTQTEKYTGILEDKISRGHCAARVAMAKARDEQPTDTIVPTPKMVFGSTEDKVHLQWDGISPMGLHPHAAGQAAQRVKIPAKFTEHLGGLGEVGATLLAHNLNELYQHTRPGAHLVRAVHGEVRGLLSDHYRRIDTGALVMKFAEATKIFGAVPVAAMCTDTKFFIKVVNPEVHLVSGDPMVFGVELHNSDYGNGAFTIRFFIMRIVCSNLMVGENTLRQVHLGRRLEEGFAFSDKTHRLDQRTLGSATVDAVNAMMKPRAVADRLQVLQSATETHLDIGQALAGLRKKSKVTKSEAESIGEIFRTGGIEQLPPGDNSWRLANSVSLFSQGEDVSSDRMLHLEQVAGALVGT